MAASGFSALGLQIVWVQQTGAWLGHEAAGILGVVTAFFGGLGLGALAFGPAIQRSARPLHWYAVAEAVIAAWSLLLLWLLGPASGALMALTGAQPTPAWQWAVAFGGTLLLLLPATAAMGATLPAMDRMLSTRPGQAVAALYAANTLGAVVGVLAAAFWLVPAWGLSTTAALCAALNLLCAAVAWWAFSPGRAAARAVSAVDAVGAIDEGISGNAANAASPPHRLALLLAATGFLGIGYEVLVVRALRQVTENTVYTFALLLAVYLVGTATGAAILHRLLGQRLPGVALRNRLLQALALACLLGMASLWALAPLQVALRESLGDGMPAALAAEAALALAVFGLPTVVMGALFSVLARQASGAGLGLGRALGLNTLGAAAAPLLLVVVLLPAVGLKFVLLGVAMGYLALSTRAALRTPPLWCLLLAGVAVALAAPPLVTVDVPPGGRLISHMEGALGTVSVVEDAGGVQRLHIDNRQQEGSNVTALADGRQALLPLLLHPAPQRALFLGLGTGVTAATATHDPAVQVEAVELLPEVVQAAALFTPALAPGAAQNSSANRLTVQVADARRFVRTTATDYDVVVSDNFHPARSGSASMYTVEHFEAVKARLAPGGIFCQWLPLHQMDLATLRSIVRSYTAVYPQAFAILATHSLDTPVVGLVSRRDGAPLQLSQVRQRLASARLEPGAADYGIHDEWALLGSLVAGPTALKRWAQGAPLNTDDHPVVSYLAPRATYAPEATPAARLLGLLQEWSVGADELLPLAHGPDADADPNPNPDRTQHARLAAYVAARKVYLTAGAGVQVTADPAQMLAQVREPLLQALRTSADFSPAYEPLLRLALALKARDPMAAQALLEELTRLAPQQPRAWQALQQQAGR